jgi:hypothetical protein
MKKECDANGLEYELLMQESAKERFLREIKRDPLDISKHLLILKQKRQSEASTTDPTVAASAPSSEEPNVAASASESPAEKENHVGAPLSALAAFGGKAAISGKTAAVAGKAALATLTAPKLLVLLRERLGNIKAPPTHAPIVLPRLGSSSPATIKITFPPFPTLKPLVVQPNHLF